MYCPNDSCKTLITCGCQLKTASDGTKGCNTCIQTLEMTAGARKNKIAVQNVPSPTAPVVTSITYQTN